MSATVKGRGVVWSTGGITYTAGIVSATNPDFPQSSRFSRTSDKKEAIDNGGVLRTHIFCTFRKTLSMTVIPCALSGTNTIANAQASADAHTLAPGTTITVVDDSGTLLDASYNLLSSTQNRTVDGIATVDLELEQGDEGNDLTTAVS